MPGRFFNTIVVASVLRAAVVTAASSGSFKLLSYNVAGLPDILSSSDPSTNTPLISARLGPYTVINVEEDFNYHAALYASDSHTYRTATSGGVPFGSGLNTLSNFEIIDEDRVKWNDCNLNDGDCLTPKGFMFMRLRTSDGTYFDLYNLHMDAGSDDGDRTARKSNWAQVTAYAQAHSQGMPLIIMGDTNSRYSSDVDGTSVRTTVSTLGLTDAWVSLARGGAAPALGSTALVCPFPFASGTNQSTMVACETVDKVLVRAGSTTSVFAPTAFTNENNAFLNSSGYPLSDHYPLATTISWTSSSSLVMGDSAGGPHGDVFSDLAAVSGARMTSFTVRGGDRVDAVSYVVGGTTLSHGGSGGTAVTLNVTGDPIVSLKLCTGKKDDTTRVFYLLATTKAGKTVQAGSTTSDCVTRSAPTTSWGLVGFWGRSGDEMDRLGPVWSATP
ncbi:Endonuclease/exonuclease/phosphatase [Auriculariales sp. MPI-PUGE-AT-0066]|nr:Endonuclease/exonuclease/phosphatase [Auriculariales sp. MPI-PUGE-AT-0066]